MGKIIAKSLLCLLLPVVAVFSIATNNPDGQLAAILSGAFGLIATAFTFFLRILAPLLAIGVAGFLITRASRHIGGGKVNLLCGFAATLSMAIIAYNTSFVFCLSFSISVAIFWIIAWLAEAYDLGSAAPDVVILLIGLIFGSVFHEVINDVSQKTRAYQESLQEVSETTGRVITSLDDMYLADWTLNEVKSADSFTKNLILEDGESKLAYRLNMFQERPDASIPGEAFTEVLNSRIAFTCRDGELVDVIGDIRLSDLTAAIARRHCLLAHLRGRQN